MAWPAKLRRWLVAIGILLVLVVSAAIVLLRFKFEGEALGTDVTEMLNAKMRGRIEIGSIEWPTSAITKLATGGWVPVTMRGVKVWDAGTPAKQILDAKLVTGEVDAHALLFRQQFVFRHIVVDGGTALIEQVDEAYPMYAYDKTVISLFQAFESPHHAGFSTGVMATGSSVFDIQDFELKHLDVTLHMGNYTSTSDPAHPLPAFTFAATLKDVAAHGFLYMDGSDPLVPKLYYALTSKDGPGLTAGKGSQAVIYLIGGVPVYTIPLDAVALTRVAQLPDKWPNVEVANSLELNATASTSDGAKLAFDGAIVDYVDRPYDGQWSINIRGENLGPTLSARLTDGYVGGADVRGTFNLRGPYLADPKVVFTMTGLDVDLPIGAKGDVPLRLAIDRVEGAIDEVNGRLEIDKTVARGADGEVQLAGTAQLAPLRLDGNVFITRPLDLARWLPARVTKVVGSRLSGSIHATGDVATQLSFDDLTNVALGSVKIDRRGKITADHYFDTIYFTKLGLHAGATAATIDGSVDTVGDTLALDVTADSRDLDVWLAKVGAPAYARSGGGTIHIRDSFAAPRIAGHVWAGGVAVVDDLAADVKLAGDQLTIDDVQSKGLGGSLRGSGHVQLGGAPQVKDFHLSGRDLDAARLPDTDGAASGTIAAAELDVSGPLDQLLIQGGARTDHLVIEGDTYDHVAMCLNQAAGRERPDARAICADAQPRMPPPADAGERARRAEVANACTGAREHGGICVTGRADREGGGTVDLTAVVGKGGALHGAVDLGGLPLSAFLGPHGPAGGDLDTRLFLGGTTRAPTAEGAIALARGWLGKAFLGNADLHVTAAGPGKIAIAGSALQGRVQLAATIGTAPPYPATLTADLRRVDLDPLIDLRKYLGVGDPVHAWTSGRVTVTTRLGDAHPPIDATVALSELAVTVEQRDADGRPAPVTVAATRPVRFRYQDGAIELACVDPGNASRTTPCPVELATPAGAITIAGSASKAVLALDVTGRLDAALLRPLLAEYVDESGGTADLEVHVRGSAAKPLVNASLGMNDVWFRPVRQDTVIHLAQGSVGLKDNDDLGFTGMKLTVKDNYTGETSELALTGGINLEDWKPKHWAVTLDGTLPAKLVLALAPESFSNASGTAQLEVQLQGYGAQPAIDGSLAFDGDHPFTLVPRSVRRELVLDGGWVNVVDTADRGPTGDACHPPKGDPKAQVGALRLYRIDLCKVGGAIDEEGRLHDITGTFELENGKLASGDVTLAADNLPFRVPHVVEATINAPELRLSSDDVTHAWSLTGGIEIVNGSYIKQYDLLKEVIKPQASSGGGSSPPIWDEYAAIGGARLDLTVDVRKFTVDNNLAKGVDLSGQLVINGSPRDPRFDGTIQVGRGEFRMPGSRAKFTRTTGAVTFSRLSHFPGETPSLSIASEADFTDPSGQQHLITLTLDGPLSLLNWDLSTSSGLNKAQTLTLILSGRTPEQFKRELGNDAVGTDPTHIETSTNPNDSYADQLIKDVAADFISLLVEDSLKDVTKLDVIRAEIGAGSVGAHGEKKLTDTINLLGDIEYTVRGRTVYVRGEWHAPFKFIVQAGYLNKTFEDAAEDDVSDLEGKLVYRFFIP